MSPVDTKWLLPLGAAACYVLLAVAVHWRLADALDIAVRDASRPGGVWGPVQIRAARVVDDFQPPHLVLPLLLGVVGLSLVRRSLRPVGVAVAVAVPAVVVTLGSKWAMARSDRAPAPVNHGSFPSGHTVSVMIVSGLVVLLYCPRSRWAWLLPGLAGCLMGSALVLAGVHPATDVIGAGLLAAAVLATAEAAGLGKWASRFDQEGAR